MKATEGDRRRALGDTEWLTKRQREEKICRKCDSQMVRVEVGGGTNHWICRNPTCRHHVQFVGVS